MDPATEPVGLSVAFQLVVPLRFNPAPGEALGAAIPPDWIDQIEDELDAKWGGVTAWDGYGRSSYQDGQRYREPQRYFVVDRPIGDAAHAWDWFAARCPQWARQFDQREIYLRVQASGMLLAYRFPSPDAPSQPEYANPFRLSPP